MHSLLIDDEVKVLIDTGIGPDRIKKVAENYPIDLLTAGGKTVLHLDSLNSDPSETYPEACDLLSLPFQGRSDLDCYTMQFIELFKPKALYLTHFDDAFPPVSANIDTT